MRRVYWGVLLAAAVAPVVAAARDAESVLRGSLIDAVVEFKEDVSDEPRSPSVRPEQGPATTNPARPRRASARDDLTSGRRAFPDNDDADEAEQRPKPREAAAAEASDGKDKSGDDTDGDDDDDDETEDGVETSFEFALRGGYDSNYDELKGGKGSGFVEASASGSVSKEIGDTTIYASADATYLAFSNLPGRHRPDGSVQTAVRHVIGENLAIQAGVESGVDATDDPVTVSGATSFGVELLRPFGSFAIRGGYDTERGVATRLGDEDFRAYDYDRPTLEASALFNPEAKLSPIATVGVSRAWFPRNLSDDTDDDGNPVVAPERDAVQITSSVGLRASLTDDLVVKLQGRMNHRDFDQKGLKTRTTFSPDVEISWSIGEDTTVEASFQRTLTESEVYGSLAEDISAFSLTYDYAPDKGFGLEMSGDFERSRELGIKDTSDDISLELVASYRRSKSTFFEIGLLKSWSIDRTGSFDTNRFKITAGGGINF